MSAAWLVGFLAASGDAVRRQLDDILSRPEYNRHFGPNAAEQFWLKAIRWFIDMLAKLGKLFSFGGSRAGRIASIVFACLAIAAFVFLMALVVRWLLARRNRRASDADGLDVAGYGLPSARPLIGEAEKRAQQGDFRGAFVCAYLASISHLDEVRALRFERSRTNWEYMRQLDRGGHSMAREELIPLTRDFDRKFYGREECTRDDYDRAVAAYTAITSRVEQAA